MSFDNDDLQMTVRIWFWPALPGLSYLIGIASVVHVQWGLHFN